MEIENIDVTKDMLKCAYFMMSADGKITLPELQKFELFCEEYPGSDWAQNSIISECDEEIARHGVYVATKKLLLACLDDEQKRYLLWILVNIAYADGEYAAAERELLRYAAKEMEMDESLVLEMEDSAETLLALKEKEKWMAGRKTGQANLEKNIKKDWDDVTNSIHALVLIG
ncbi:MAG: TerB family tellurite resistance protein [Alistipes senegalensis]|nr:TerB family tellurite resistance protein [Oxalobacter formigenes]MCM1280313.1 TerB family tellurite resistance protein [Alistipes senegalensis]